MGWVAEFGGENKEKEKRLHGKVVIPLFLALARLLTGHCVELKDIGKPEYFQR